METKKCPNCRAEIPALSLKCEYCDTEIIEKDVALGEFIINLEKKLSEADESISEKKKMLYGTTGIINKKVSIIQSFSVPNNKIDLLDLLIHASTTAQSLRGGVQSIQNGPLIKAWDGKAAQAYQKLSILTHDDKSLQNKIEPFEASYGISSVAKGSEKFSKSRDESVGDKGAWSVLMIAVFLGWVGGHRFYTGHFGIGIIQLCTFGGFFLWLIIDIILILIGRFKDSKGNLLQGKILPFL
jgi:TM2 domain-containing membrane protein YozV